MKFTKMHGAGNDYVYVDGFREKIDNPEALAIRLSDRHKGIGSDGLVLILPSETCDFRMRMFNADGSEAQMCGNASRCVGKYVYDNGYTDKQTISLETKAGTKILELFPVNGKVEKVKVDMGEPVLSTKKIPVNWPEENLINQIVDFGQEKLAITAVSMGNPHAIIFLEEENLHSFKDYKGMKALTIAELGKTIENSRLFPEKTNVEFVEVLSPTHANMRVWERGSGETQACGTGACAALVAAVLNNKLERKATVSLLGGDLELEWNAGNNHVFMTGPATQVFDGEIEL
ncbi:MAG: diaminopimelate epimerase [Dysgonamonadaceae bacterium]|jgi:diaminopimelate epimerase|nr:diaminopimelate epimerase [Dysgonamonadaceae bacterium]